jgi:hypothetical protein
MERCSACLPVASRAAWRLERADRIEAELFAHEIRGDGDLGMALIRDGHGARAFQTLLRYRGVAQAELWRALRMLKVLAEVPKEPEPRTNADGFQATRGTSAGPSALPAALTGTRGAAMEPTGQACPGVAEGAGCRPPG